jgi:zinc D-Ala-D-Ala carboxypeptidase
MLKEQTKLSQYISWAEALSYASCKRNGVDIADNQPSDKALKYIKDTIKYVFEPIRAHFNTPIGVTTFYRGTALNGAVKGVKSSQHTLGQALDIDADIYGNITNNDIAIWAIDNLEFDQLILEDVKADGTIGWLHISYVDNKNRGKINIMVKAKGKTKYIPFEGNEHLILGYSESN